MLILNFGVEVRNESLGAVHIEQAHTIAYVKQFDTLRVAGLLSGN